jgi:hypothetical protein
VLVILKQSDNYSGAQGEEILCRSVVCAARWWITLMIKWGRVAPNCCLGLDILMYI